MRGAVLFAVGVLVGSVIAKPAAEEHLAVGLNHVGVSVKDFDAAVRYYTGTLGFAPRRDATARRTWQPAWHRDRLMSGSG